MTAVLGVLLLLAGWRGAADATQASNTVTVSAAISLSDVLGHVADAYAAAGGGPVRFNFAGSNVLARQIVNGAPVDVFISADERQMEYVARAGRLQPGTRRIVLENRLAVAALPERADAVREAFPRAGAVIRRLAIGDPAAVPAGVYARRYLERQGLWRAYAGRVIPTGNVRAALAAVENGSADAAIVYATDVLPSRRPRIVIEIPREQTPDIRYPAALVAGREPQAAAAQFLSFLESDDARAIFAQHGFLLPSSR